MTVAKHPEKSSCLVDGLDCDMDFACAKLSQRVFHIIDEMSRHPALAGQRQQEECIFGREKGLRMGALVQVHGAVAA